MQSVVRESHNFIFLSSAHDAIKRSFGENLAQCTQLVCPVKDDRKYLCDTRHNLIDLSSEAVSIFRPDELKSTERTADVCARNTSELPRIVGTQIRTVKSLEAVAIIEPSGDQAISLMTSVCASNLMLRRDCSKFHLIADLSEEQEAISFLRGLNTIPVTYERKFLVSQQNKLIREETYLFGMTFKMFFQCWIGHFQFSFV